MNTGRPSRTTRREHPGAASVDRRMTIDLSDAAPTIIHGSNWPALPLPRTLDVVDADGCETWVQRLAHPYREDQELFCDVPAAEAMEFVHARIAGWRRRPADRRIDRDHPWFVRLPWLVWLEYLDESIGDSSVLDVLVNDLSALEIIILVEPRLVVIAEYELDVRWPAVPESAATAMRAHHYPDGPWRPAHGDEDRTRPVRNKSGKEVRAREVHHTCWVSGQDGVEVLRHWPRRPGAWGATRWLGSTTTKRVKIRLMSDGSQQIVAESVDV